MNGETYNKFSMLRIRKTDTDRLVYEEYVGV
jgi:hypothetical protein